MDCDEILVGDQIRVSIDGRSSIFTVTKVDGDEIYLAGNDGEHLIYLDESGKWVVYQAEDMGYQIECIPHATHLTGDSFVDLQILSELSDDDLTRICQTNRYTRDLCEDQDFWKSRLADKFNENVLKEKPADWSFREFYVYLVNIPINSDGADKLAERGNLEMLKWLSNYEIVGELPKRHGLPPVDRRIFPLDKGIFLAAKNGHLDVLKWLNSERHLAHYDMKAARGAVVGGNIEILDWLNEVHLFPPRFTNYVTPAPVLAMLAARHGNIQVLQWFLDNGFAIWSEATSSAAESGHFDTLLWLIDNGIHLHDNAINRAVIEGHFDIAEWLEQPPRSQVPSRSVYYWTAVEGNLEGLKWLEDRGVEFSGNGLHNIIQQGGPEVSRWIISQGSIPTRFDATAAIRHPELLFQLAEMGILPENSDVAVYLNQWDIFEWLAEREVYPTTQSANHLAGQGRVDLLKRFEQDFNVLPNHEGANKAESNNQYETVEWLTKRGIRPG